jgi:DNA-binding NtrC family response regulator
MNKKRVLIVEDEEMIAELEREILEREGFEIEIAQDGTEGLERLKQNEYIVVISDFQTTKMKGDEFYLEVKRLNQDLEKRIIFVSGTINDFIESTGNIFLRKPFSNEQFLEIVKDLATSIELSRKQQK